MKLILFDIDGTVTMNNDLSTNAFRAGINEEFGIKKS